MWKTSRIWANWLVPTIILWRFRKNDVIRKNMGSFQNRALGNTWNFRPNVKSRHNQYNCIHSLSFSRSFAFALNNQQFVWDFNTKSFACKGPDDSSSYPMSTCSATSDFSRLRTSIFVWCTNSQNWARKFALDASFDVTETDWPLVWYQRSPRVVAGYTRYT